MGQNQQIEQAKISKLPCILYLISPIQSGGGNCLRKVLFGIHHNVSEKIRIKNFVKTFRFFHLHSKEYIQNGRHNKLSQFARSYLCDRTRGIPKNLGDSSALTVLKWEEMFLPSNWNHCYPPGKLRWAPQKATIFPRNPLMFKICNGFLIKLAPSQPTSLVPYAPSPFWKNPKHA